MVKKKDQLIAIVVTLLHIPVCTICKPCIAKPAGWATVRSHNTSQIQDGTSYYKFWLQKSQFRIHLGTYSTCKVTYLFFWIYYSVMDRTNVIKHQRDVLPLECLWHIFGCTLCSSASLRPAHISFTTRFQSSVSDFRLASNTSGLLEVRMRREGIRTSRKGAEAIFTSCTEIWDIRIEITELGYEIHF